MDLTSKYKSVGYGTRQVSDITHICVHHMGVPGFVSKNPLKEIDSIHTYHKYTLGWPGIGYHIVVAEDGWYLVNPLDVVSWHVAYHNSYTVGLIFLGDYTNGGQPSDAMILHAQDAVDYVKDQASASITILGHSDFSGNNTACPGTSWLAWKHLLTGPYLDFKRLRTYPEWALARITNKEEPRDLMAFIEHLRNLGADYRYPKEYGWPC